MKSVLMSIKPKYCELIANGKKTVEVRKTKPKIDVPFKCYIYCTKDKEILGWHSEYKDNIRDNEHEYKVFTLHGQDKNAFNGKVIGEFVCDRIQEITYTQIYNFGRYKDVCEAETRLDFYALDDYLKQKNGYAWHISNLVIYDKPKELGEFYQIGKPNIDYCIGCIYHETLACEFPCYSCNRDRKYLTRPPQSWCYVEELGV